MIRAVARALIGGGGGGGVYSFTFLAVRYPCFLANQNALFAVRYFTIRTAQPDRCGLQITIITKKFKIKYVLKAKNTLTMLKIEK